MALRAFFHSVRSLQIVQSGFVRITEYGKYMANITNIHRFLIGLNPVYTVVDKLTIFSRLYCKLSPGGAYFPESTVHQSDFGTLSKFRVSLM